MFRYILQCVFKLFYFYCRAWCRHPHVSKGLASSSRYTETYYNWSIRFIGGHYRIVETSIHINMALNVYGYGRGGKCICKLTHAYVWITKMEIEKEMENKDMSKVMSTWIDTLTYVSIRFISKVEIKLGDNKFHRPLHKPYTCTYP